MKLLKNILALALIITEGPAIAESTSTGLCKDYWEARKSGQDWRYHPSLSDYDSACSSNMIIAKDWLGNCGVHVRETGGYETMGSSSWISISWFKCQVGDIELSFGDFVEGTTERICLQTCDGCATGPRTTCSVVFTPSNAKQE